MKTEIADKKIFIVEDEIVVANDIRNILQNNGFEVSGMATKYETAKKEITRLTPNLILCDIQLRSVKTGIELIREISVKHDFKTIFITAYTDVETLKMAKEVNSFHYIIKPFTEQQLVTSVRMALLPEDSLDSGKSRPTNRELEIVQLISEGLSNQQIGEKLNISQFTVKTHRSNLLKKYNVNSSVELVSLSINNRWI